jgi:hypothetical protein
MSDLHLSKAKEVAGETGERKIDHESPDASCWGQWFEAGASRPICVTGQWAKGQRARRQRIYGICLGAAIEGAGRRRANGVQAGRMNYAGAKSANMDQPRQVRTVGKCETVRPHEETISPAVTRFMKTETGRTSPDHKEDKKGVDLNRLPHSPNAASNSNAIERRDRWIEMPGATEVIGVDVFNLGALCQEIRGAIFEFF